MPDLDIMPPGGALEETEEQRRQRLGQSPMAMPARPVAPQSPIAISSPSGMPPANMAATPRPEPVATPSTMPPNIMPPHALPEPSSQAAPQVPHAMPAAPVQPPAQAPELHGWRKALNTVGNVLPWSAPFMGQIPGTPQNFDMKQAMAAARQDSGQKLEAGRLANVAEQQKIDQGPATADLNRRNVESEIKTREAPKPGKEEEWSVVPNVLGPNGEAVQQEKTSGQIRVVSTPGVSVKEQPVKPDSATQEDQRFESIDAAKRMGKPVSPEDKAWADAYKNRKTLGPQVNLQGADERGKAFGRNRPTQVLDTWNGNRPVVVSSGDAEDNPDRYVTQSGGEKALPKTALLNDIRVVAGKVAQNLDVLDEKGFDRATLAAALGNPATTFESYLQGIPRGALSEKEQQFVSDIFNLREQAMSMRQLLGAGAGAEDVRSAILSTLPGVSSGSSGFGKKQLDNLTQTLDRLEQGVPKVPLNNSAKPKSAPSFSEWNKKQGK